MKREGDRERGSEVDGLREEKIESGRELECVVCCCTYITLDYQDILLMVTTYASSNSHGH